MNAEQIGRVIGALIGSALAGWMFGNTWIGLACGAWITIAFWEMPKRHMTTSAVTSSPVEDKSASATLQRPEAMATIPGTGKEAPK